MNPFSEFAEHLCEIAAKIGMKTTPNTQDELANRLLADDGYRYRIYAMVFQLHAVLIDRARTFP